MHKLILQNNQAPGDIVMLTAAVRDLHKTYPGKFITDVRTSATDLWLNNPYISNLSIHKSDVQTIYCNYPLVHTSNNHSYHFLYGFIHYLNEQLNLEIKLTDFKGDIHLSEHEKQQSPQVQSDKPLWLIVSGGKHDFTAKWWDVKRYQQVVDHFKNRIQFVQVGESAHHHPLLNNAIDLRGKTTLRQLINLVYHAQGAITPVSLLMHLAAAVETKSDEPIRQCIVIAGGREPVSWEKYPAHNFLHTIGELDCCKTGGCWKSRVKPLGDGSSNDAPENLCVDVVNNLPHCLDMITAEKVIEQIEDYFNGEQVKSSDNLIQNTVMNTDKISANYVKPNFLTENNSLEETDKFIAQIPPYPEIFEEKGIVICGGGVKYFTNAWVLVNHLKRLGCSLPVQLWYLGENELDETMINLMKGLDVECVDGFKIREQHPVRILNGWELKAYSLLHCSFEEVLLLDADNIPVINPEQLFNWQQYVETGSVFWPDVGNLSKGRKIWELLGIQFIHEMEFESGQILVNKKKCWKALNLSMWLNEYSDLYYRYIHGDKETFHMAFRKLEQTYAMTRYHVILSTGVMYQHDLDGKIIFQHRNSYKWDFYGNNPKLPGFQYEDECLAYLDILKNSWDGVIDKKKKKNLSFTSETERHLLSTAWTYERVGYGKRPMTFLRNGFIGTGRGGCETNWELIEENKTTRLNITGNDGLICSLQFDENKKHWHGQWLKHEKMQIIISSLSS